jgi:hypothetical protein
MKLLRQGRAGWKFELEPKEAMFLRALVSEFPLSAATVAKISRKGRDANSAERQQLLNESLAQHRRELKKQAGKLLTTRLKHEKSGWRLSLSAGERETLLQLLNDIRVESWHALGEPQNLDALPPPASDADLRHYNLMQLAGFFEWKMLEVSQ